MGHRNGAPQVAKAIISSISNNSNQWGAGGFPFNFFDNKLRFSENSRFQRVGGGLFPLDAFLTFCWYCRAVPDTYVHLSWLLRSVLPDRTPYPGTAGLLNTGH